MPLTSTSSSGTLRPPSSTSLANVTVDEVVSRLCAALEAALPAGEEMGEDRLSAEVADFLMIRGMTDYDSKESIELAARVIEYGVDAVLMREMATATEVMLDTVLPLFDRVETVIARCEKEVRDNPALKFPALLLDKLAVLRAKRTDTTPEKAREVILEFESTRANSAVQESMRRKKSAFNERTRKFEDAQQTVSQVRNESMRLKSTKSRPRIDLI
ncbi:hypothetical protein CAOG_04841 [Capsaspora owczarzaki ATCC 30864]|uniref:Uncharacterized protein n=1 Tax=Capsaspora owczarzaki (strain ATCC 30864) TaxID=595528 RepID=A0A0D2VSQ5_CAPO3|nr:hypothetical protein CAOG_04841 [Capsaspora owczarzaki ATCC 30864]KJE94157.1 hypothetical protein CAOG_004841 [Capsaspora owczarzaki ATCC 30864]|eukprot:XP_004347592.1 hypothetical protein CAOG_04841 [Capsaspora owczarzaki ATCC 30864]